MKIFQILLIIQLIKQSIQDLGLTSEQWTPVPSIVEVLPAFEESHDLSAGTTVHLLDQSGEAYATHNMDFNSVFRIEFKQAEDDNAPELCKINPEQRQIASQWEFQQTVFKEEDIEVAMENVNEYIKYQEMKQQLLAWDKIESGLLFSDSQFNIHVCELDMEAEIVHHDFHTECQSIFNYKDKIADSISSALIVEPPQITSIKNDVFMFYPTESYYFHVNGQEVESFETMSAWVTVSEVARIRKKGIFIFVAAGQDGIFIYKYKDSFELVHHIDGEFFGLSENIDVQDISISVHTKYFNIYALESQYGIIRIQFAPSAATTELQVALDKDFNVQIQNGKRFHQFEDRVFVVVKEMNGFHIAYEYEVVGNKYYLNENYHYHETAIKDVILNMHYGILIGYNSNKIFWHGIHKDHYPDDKTINEQFLYEPGMVDAMWHFELSISATPTKFVTDSLVHLEEKEYDDVFKISYNDEGEPNDITDGETISKIIHDLYMNNYVKTFLITRSTKHIILQEVEIQAPNIECSAHKAEEGQKSDYRYSIYTTDCNSVDENSSETVCEFKGLYSFTVDTIYIDARSSKAVFVVGMILLVLCILGMVFYLFKVISVKKKGNYYQRKASELEKQYSGIASSDNPSGRTGNEQTTTNRKLEMQPSTLTGQQPISTIEQVPKTEHQFKNDQNFQNDNEGQNVEQQ